MRVWDYIVDLISEVRADWLDWLGEIDLPSSVIVFLDSILGILLILLMVFPIVLIFMWVERRFLARFQLRPGPNRCGPLGLLQPIADAIKIMLKEFIAPAQGDKLVHWIAPVVVFFPALAVFAVLPIGGRADDLAGTGIGALADLNIGILYIVAIGSVGVVGIFMAGWGSNNKYSLLGAMRAVAQLVSYEVPMVLSIMGVVLIAGSMQLGTIIEQQNVPYILLQPLGLFIYLMGALAELNRSPMDQLEADSELTTGYHTEYSGMKFGMFFVGEYINTVAVAAIISTLFLGGWKVPWNIAFPVWLFFIMKIFIVFMIIVWMRATLMRIRIDQIMAFSWKFLIPMALINIFLTAGEILIWREYMAGWEYFPWPFMFVNWAIAVVLIILWSKAFFKLGGGRVEVREIRAGYSQGLNSNPQTPVS